MKFVVARDDLLAPVQSIAAVVERRQTMPALANALLEAEKGKLTLKSTDLEIELVVGMPLSSGETAGATTVNARKLMEICQRLPVGSELSGELVDEKLMLRSGSSRFSLATIDAAQFPATEEGATKLEFTLGADQFRGLIDKVAFAMASTQDPRHYFNGMLLELEADHVRTVTANGHRLAMATLKMPTSAPEAMRVIVPRKAVAELAKLLGGVEDSVRVLVGDNQVRVFLHDYIFTSKLIEEKFPDYSRVFPSGKGHILRANRQALRDAFNRAAVVGEEAIRAIRLSLKGSELRIYATNPEQEESEELLQVEYDGEDIEIAFNVLYLLDVMGALTEESVEIELYDAERSSRISTDQDSDSVYVVMPLRL